MTGDPNDIIGIPVRPVSPHDPTMCSRHRHCGRKAVYELDGSDIKPRLDPPTLKVCAECLSEFMVRSAPNA